MASPFDNLTVIGGDNGPRKHKAVVYDRHLELPIDLSFAESCDDYDFMGILEVNGDYVHYYRTDLE